MPRATDDLGGEELCYLTTIGRRTGNPHTIEIWFALRGSTLYMLSGDGEHERSDWVRNLLKEPKVGVLIGEHTLTGVARLIEDKREDSLARRLVVEKYQPGYDEDLSDWRIEARPVAVDLDFQNPGLR